MSKNHLSKKNPLKTRHECRQLDSKCSLCRKLKDKWYSKLKDDGFVDIENGKEESLYLYNSVTVTDPLMDVRQNHYEIALEVHLEWIKERKSKRDIRIAELYSKQEGKTGTYRGICKTLKRERYKGYSMRAVCKVMQRLRIQIKKKMYDT